MSPQVYVDDLDDLLDVAYSPPRDGQGIAIADMTAWTQQITLTWRSPTDLSSVVTVGSTDVIHVDIDISFQGRPVLNTGWLVTRRD